MTGAQVFYTTYALFNILYERTHGKGKEKVADKKEWIVEGYLFGSPADAEQARTERRKASYFETKLEGKPARSILAVYDKMLEGKGFVTPVGWEYLKQIQDKLRLQGVEEEEIKPVALYSTFVHKEEKKVNRPRDGKPKEKVPYRKRFLSSVIVNVMLAALVAAMFLIATGSDHPNIINYRNEIVNEYAAWDQELTEREKAVRLKEAELGLETEAGRESGGEEDLKE